MPGWGGVHATTDADGRPVLLVKLWTGVGFDCERNLLWIDAETGESRLITPPDGSHGLGSYGTFLSHKNRFYDMVAKGPETSFYEFDVAAQEWTTFQKITLKGDHRFAMSCTETDDGTIYAGILSPGGGLVRFRPDTQELEDLGPLLAEDWLVYPFLISDGAGWVYAATEHKEGRVIAWKESEGKRELEVPGQHGVVKGVWVFRGTSGRAFIRFLYQDGTNLWLEAFDGRLTPCERPSEDHVLETQGWRDWRDFGDGHWVESLVVPNRTAVIRDPNGAQRELMFDYPAKGAEICSLTTGADGTVYGSSGNPLRFFAFHPSTGHREDHGLAGHGGHINGLVSLKDKLYGAVYSSGTLIEIDPSKPWQDLWPLTPDSNPRLLYDQPEGVDLVGRPFVLHAHPDGHHVLLGGNPSRASAGGGMVVFDVQTGNQELIGPEALVPGQGIKCLATLKDGTVLGGTTRQPGTGGVEGHEDAVLFVFDWKKQAVTKRLSLPGIHTVLDLLSPDGRQVVGVGIGASKLEFFHLPDGTLESLRTTDIAAHGPPPQPQAPRLLSRGPHGRTFLLMQKEILEWDPNSGSLRTAATAPVPITAGSAWSGSRLYFASNGDLWSWNPEKR